MTRKWWIILGLVAVGVGLAIVIGVAANSQSVAEKQYCDSLSSLKNSLESLDSVSPSTDPSSGEVQTDIQNVQSAWGDVKSQASNLEDVNQQSLDSAWNSFESAVKNLTNGGSLSDVQSAGKSLTSTVETNLDTYDC